jgi:hypothetical protein
MPISDTLDAVRTQTLRRHVSAYAAARAHLPLLATYATAEDLLGALQRASGVNSKRKLLRLLVEQAQSTKHPLWEGLLLAAFTPMLVKLRKRSARPDVAEEDQDEVVLLAFLNAVQTIRPEKFPALGLFWATARTIFDRTRQDRRSPETARFDEDVHAPLPFAALAQASARAEVMELIDALMKRAASGGTLHRRRPVTIVGIDVLVCTHALGEPLHDYVYRTRPPKQRNNRTYGALLRERDRALHAARSHFEQRGTAIV